MSGTHTVLYDPHGLIEAELPLDRSFPPLLFVFAPVPRRAAPATREAAFHDRARRVGQR
ncbi:hypothetical protein ACFU8Q_32150 [Streptomyces sp. NPDC057543]|uniref:hypothetical protein n=1 Tax=Streptomyces sp. NPDC057543 TaxID=3346163 RepID=UPI0036963729